MHIHPSATLIVTLVVALFSLFGGTISVAADKPLPIACTAKCKTPYGEVLGRSPSNVEAYSNCSSACVVFIPNTVDRTYTGIKWQCVEYARRWLLINRGAVFGDVDIAADMWNKIDHLTRVSDQITIPLVAHLNGSEQPPQVGDLLIYAKTFNDTGHVAVVTAVEPEQNLIKVGEQNFNNQRWPGSYARQIEYIKKNGGYWMLDPYLLGWKHVSQ